MTENTLNLSTLIVGEEGHTTHIAGEEDLRAHADNDAFTTLALGEEGTTHVLGEEVTTLAIGEEIETTTSLGEENTVAPHTNTEGGPFGAY
jgi:hypothetical protein